MGLPRSAYYHIPVDWQVHDADVIEALNKLVEAHPRWGVWKYIARLQALGHPWNHKQIYRVYRQLGLNHPRRTKRRLPARPSIAAEFDVDAAGATRALRRPGDVDVASDAEVATVGRTHVTQLNPTGAAEGEAVL